MKDKFYKLFIGIFTVVFIWELLYLIINNSFIFPHFIDVSINAIKKIFTLNDFKLLLNTSLSLLVIIIISIMFSIIFSYLSFINKYISYIFKPIISILKTTPLIVILLIILILFGLNNSSIFIVFLVTFPISYQGLKNHYKEIKSNFDYVLRLEKTSHIRFFTNVYLPLSKNQIRTSLIQTAGLGLKVLIMSEYILQTPNTIGRKLYYDKLDMNFISVYSWAFIIIIISLIIDFYIYKLKALD